MMPLFFLFFAILVYLGARSSCIVGGWVAGRYENTAMRRFDNTALRRRNATVFVRLLGRSVKMVMRLHVPPFIRRTQKRPARPEISDGYGPHRYRWLS